MENIKVSDFMLALDRITKNTKRIIDIALQKYGLRSTHASCFFRICEDEKGLSSTELSEACGVDKAFISRITNELMEKDYIMKDEKNAIGKYRTKMILTEKGWEVHSAIVGILEECFKQVDANLTAKKLDVFYDALSKIDRGISSLLK